jgi:hypothetical protein
MLDNLLEKNVDISNLSNFKTKAFAKYYYEIHSRQDLENIKDIYIYATEKKLKILLV